MSALRRYPQDSYDVAPVVADVEAAGRRCLARALDVRDPRAVDGFVEETASLFGDVHIAVANAGIAPRTPLASLSDEAWNRVLDVDLTGAMRLFRASIPFMRAAGYGRLIATSSVAGTEAAWAEHVPYAAAKAGLVGMVRSWGAELAADGITTNAVAPGSILTPQFLDPVNSGGQDAVGPTAARNPTGRIGLPEDVAYTFQFLASPGAGYVNGQRVVVDGGRHLLALG
ncbi:MAG: SDR family oxidoreductase [Micrococcales bacterium]|nr:SDR family oxidoreductase [Micrococcales bacterium]